MYKLLRSAALLLMVLGLAAAPLHASAQQASAGTEVITFLVDAATPTGIQVTGSLLITRHTDSSTWRDGFSFSGLVNGKQTSASGTGTENWTSDGQIAINLDSFSNWNIPAQKPSMPLSLSFVQSSDHLATLNGIPVAISGKILPPGSGNATYQVANPGKGTMEIQSLPKTGNGPPVLTLAAISRIIVLAGAAVLALGLYLGRALHRSSSAAEKRELS